METTNRKGICPDTGKAYVNAPRAVLSEGGFTKIYSQDGKTYRERYSVIDDLTHCPGCGCSLSDTDYLSFTDIRVNAEEDTIVAQCECSEDFNGCGRVFEHVYKTFYKDTLVDDEAQRRSFKNRIFETAVVVLARENGTYHIEHCDWEPQMGPVFCYVSDIELSQYETEVNCVTLSDREFEQDFSLDDLDIDALVALLRGLGKHTYHLGVIDHNVSIPEDIDKEYATIDEAYEALSAFVHSYDYVKQVDGRVMDEDCEDVEYSSSIPVDEYERFDSRLTRMGSEAFGMARRKLARIGGSFVLPETVTLYIDTCNGYDYLYELKAAKVVLLDKTLVILAELDEDTEDKVLHDDDYDVGPSEAWFEGGYTYAEWEGLFEVIDKLMVSE